VIPAIANTPTMPMQMVAPKDIPNKPVAVAAVYVTTIASPTSAAKRSLPAIVVSAIYCTWLLIYNLL
jgi:hypothetical protein